MPELPRLDTLDTPTAYDIAEMSQETLADLRKYIRVGFTDQRGFAWWDSGLPDGTHFPGAVPQEEVMKILAVSLVEAKIWVEMPNGDLITDPDKKAIVWDEEDRVMYYASQGYQIHPYLEVLSDFITQIAFDEHAGVGSVGLLQRGGMAFLQAVLPETYEVEGYGFVPYLLGVTSANGKRATSWSLGVKAGICDNTVNMALNAALAKSKKYKHTRNSLPKVEEVRNQLGLRLAQVGEEMSETFETLMGISVSDQQWQDFLDLHHPFPEVKEGGRTNGYTRVENTRDELTRLYTKDEKAARWNGSAFGVLQTENTFNTWNRGTDDDRLWRNFLNMATETDSERDAEVIADLSQVLELDLV